MAEKKSRDKKLSPEVQKADELRRKALTAAKEATRVHGSARATQEKSLHPNPFAGADDIYVTKNKIAVTRTKKAKAARGFKKMTQTKYYARNARNIKQLKAAQGDTVRDGRKGTKFTRL